MEKLCLSKIFCQKYQFEMKHIVKNIFVSNDFQEEDFPGIYLQ